jgi:hypothetical protein
VSIPAALVAGDKWQWDTDYGDYPQPTWDGTAYFENADHAFSVAASANGTLHRFAETAVNTAALKAGRYYVQVRVTDGTSPTIVESGWCNVKADPASAAKVDHRTWARRTLDAIEAFLEGNATTAQQSMSIQGRSISRWSIAELMQFRNDLRGEVRAEEQGLAAGLGRDIKVRYGSP